MDQISFASRPWIWSVNIFTATMDQISFSLLDHGSSVLGPLNLDLLLGKLFITC